MPHHSFLPHKKWLLWLALLTLLVASVLPVPMQAQSTEQTLYKFGSRGPNGGLIFDAQGNLYGTLSGSGLGFGKVFELRHFNNTRWIFKLLFGFTDGIDGAYPHSDLIFDGAGNLYGAAAAGGANHCNFSNTASGCGLVFKLTPTPAGQWTETVLYNFAGGTDGSNPSAGVISDGAGNLYGTTAFGGLFHGTVFELSPSPSGTWSEKVLYSFTGGADGNGPSGGLVLDGAGNLYGTTFVGGKTGNCGNQTCGTAFELSPGPNNTWTFHLLHKFCSRANCSDGGGPFGLVLDSNGNLYGTTAAGGIAPCWARVTGCGTAYKLSRGINGNWNFTVLHSFCSLSTCPDGAGPSGRLILDNAAGLYGVTVVGGNNNQGTAFKLSHVPNHPWTLNSLYSFCAIAGCADGLNPGGSLTFDSAGDLFGTT